ncbi:MAG: hypothetical protein NZ518_00965 [Dehalococcoidia bacterium]|nr:hypothetical protein [Dehalococcoidia bacterium]
MLIGNIVIVAIIVGVAGFRWSQTPPTRTAQTAGAPEAVEAPSVQAALARRPDAATPHDVALLALRFLATLASENAAAAARDVAPGDLSRLNIGERLATAAIPFQSAQARNFRVIQWQPPSDPVAAGRLTVSFDFDRPDGIIGRSRVGLIVLQREGQWYVTEIDFGPWMSDLGLARAN